MMKSSVCNYSDAYIFVKGTISVTNTAGAGNFESNIGKKKFFFNCASFTDCISQIKNTQDIDIVMSMYNVIEYSNNYSKTSKEVYGSIVGMNQV